MSRELASDTYWSFDYNPAKVDGVALIVGVVNGQLIGEQLRTRTCEVVGAGEYI